MDKKKLAALAGAGAIAILAAFNVEWAGLLGDFCTAAVAE